MRFTNARTGTTVVSDQGAAFLHMKSVVGGDHLTVNHSKGFSQNGIDSNTVETRNKQIKDFLKRHGRGSPNEDCLWRNLAQYMWEQWYTDGSSTMKFGMFFLALYDKHGF